MTSVTLWPVIRLCKQAVIALTIVVVVAACGGNDNEPETPPASEATAAVTGMVMPTPAQSEAPTTAAVPTAEPAAVEALFIGDTVQSLPEQEVRLYNDATATAPVLSVYVPGAQFTVLDPSGDYAIYPVERDGRVWYRLRAPDGLVGWGAVDQLAAVQ